LRRELLKSQSERESQRPRKPKVKPMTSLLKKVVKHPFTESKAQPRPKTNLDLLKQDHRPLMLPLTKSLREREHQRKRRKMQKKAKPMANRQNHVRKLLSLNTERKVTVRKLMRRETLQLVVKRPRKVARSLKIKDLPKIWFIRIQWISRRKESSRPNGKNIVMEIGEKALERLTSNWKQKFLQSQTSHCSSQRKAYSTRNRLKSRRRSRRSAVLLTRRKLHLKRFSIRRSRILMPEILVWFQPRSSHPSSKG